MPNSQQYITLSVRACLCKRERQEGGGGVGRVPFAALSPIGAFLQMPSHTPHFQDIAGLDEVLNLSVGVSP